MERRENVFAVAFRVLVERPSLAVMMFLQYAIWGAWSVALAGYLEQELGFAGLGLALIYNALPLMSLIVPFTAGQVADRFMPAQRALALFHLLGGLLLFGLAFQRELSPDDRADARLRLSSTRRRSPCPTRSPSAT
jgi:MFS family permease